MVLSEELSTLQRHKPNSANGKELKNDIDKCIGWLTGNSWTPFLYLENMDAVF